MELALLEKVKRLTIVAMFSDDNLLDKLVLKGGNALDIVHKLAERGSVDLDFSIEDQFNPKDLDILVARIEQRLKITFEPEGLIVFDVCFSEEPKKVSTEVADFWGGYRIDFKVISTKSYNKYKNLGRSMSSRAMVVGPGQHKKIKIQISKFEYCARKQRKKLDGYTLYVYTPLMILFEKLRAICQQLPEYQSIVPNPSLTPRARDFFDIYTVLNTCNIDLSSAENQRILEDIFNAKRVPLRYMSLIKFQREFHRPDFHSVIDTVKPSVEIRNFDFYFDYVLEVVKLLEPVWNE